MAANHHLNRTLFHGTVRAGWEPPEWFHAGDLSAASRRLKATSETGGLDEDEYDGEREPAVFSLRIRPDVRVANKVAAKHDRETGLYMDLGHRQQEGDPHIDHLMETHDVIPYENVDEGGTSYLVRGSAVESHNRFKRYSGQ